MKIKKAPDTISHREIYDKFRKPMPPKGFAFKDKSKYTRKKKHRGSNVEPPCVSFFV